MFGSKKKLSNKPRRKVVDGQERQPVFSYYGRHLTNRAHTPRAALNKRIGLRPWWHFVPSIMSILAISLSLIYMLGLSVNPKVISPTSDTPLLRPISDYQQVAQKQFESSWLNHSKLTVNTTAISNQLKQEFPELAEVNIALPLVGRRPVVYVVSSQLVLVLRARSGNFVINNQGKAISELDQQTSASSKYLPEVIDQSGLEVKAGQTAMPASYVTFISTVLQQLRTKQFKVDNIILPARSFELNIRLKEQPYMIKMNLQNDVLQQIGTFFAAEQKLSQDGQKPSAYFDVRVPGRVYYK